MHPEEIRDDLRCRATHPAPNGILSPMTITFMGDSLTAGNLGIPFLRYLPRPSGRHFVNRGKDGDTVRGLLSRLGDALAADVPDIVVLEAGANDILLPEMAARGGAWTPFVEEMTASGSVPTPDPEEFADLYARLLSAAAVGAARRVVAMTIPPIGENLESARNRRRSELNRRIRRAVENAEERNRRVHLADAAAAFESALRESPLRSDHFFGEPGDFAADARRIRRDRNAEALSKERGLLLTMDGAHLNEKGAKMAAGILNEALGG